MNLFFDENIGSGIPTALQAVGVRGVHHTRRAFRARIAAGEPVLDADWLPIAGQRGWLVITKDRQILESEYERTLLIEHRVGVVFLNIGQAPHFELLRLILNQWEWLLDIDARVARPFAFVLAPDGRAERDGRV